MENITRQHLAALLAGEHTQTGDQMDAGAQMTVTGPDGREVFRAPLARHHRADTADPDVIWIRPVLGGGTGPDGAYQYNLSVARRRSLSVASSAVDPGGTVVLTLRNGQTARISAAAEDELAELHRWDTFVYSALTDQEHADLRALAGDSWHGRFG
jgi:hypothetical protein